MQTMRNTLWILIAVLLLAGGLGAAWLWKRVQAASPQIVTLSNGTQLRFEAATYGTNHVMGPTLTRMVNRLPKWLGDPARRILGNRLGRLNSHTTLQPSLCVWFEVLGGTPAAPGRPASVRAVLADETGVMGGDQQYVSVWRGGGAPPWLSPNFPAMPRRSRFLQCCFLEMNPGGDPHEVGRVRFRNPVFDRYPHWEPEPLPAVKMAGDVEARLESFSTGHSGSSESISTRNGKKVIRFKPARPGEEARAAFELHLVSPRTNELWTLNGAEFSDATGNRQKVSSRSETGRGHFAIGPVLWPDEAAWRLKLELERKSGFAPDELVTFKDVPIPPEGETNSLERTASAGQVQLTLKEFVRKPDIKEGSWSSSDASHVRIEHTKVPEGWSLDFVEILGEDGSPFEVLSRSWTDTAYHFYVRSIPTNVSRADITFAVQRTREVEFLVKPVAVQAGEARAME